MTIRLRQFALQLRASYWFVPAVLTAGAIILSLLTLWLDELWPEMVRTLLGPVAVMTPDGARQLLGTISTGMISVAGTVFAITIAAVVYASGTYGPRLLFNFMTDRGNQFALGVFIATYLYCLLALRAVKGGEAGGDAIAVFVPQLTLLVALGLSLCAVAVLVYFLHHVPASIRINSVLSAIGRQAMEAVRRRYPDLGDADPPSARSGEDWQLVSDHCGYIELIDFGALAEIAGAHELKLSLACRTGDFVQRGMVLLTGEGAFEASVRDRMHGAFVFGAQRTAEQDIEYLIDEMVEIALRALSPSMNDPFTAITSLFWIGAVTGAIAVRDLDRDPDGVKSSSRGVLLLPDDFGHFMRRGFGGVMPSAAAHPMVAGVFAQVLANVTTSGCSAGRIGLLRAELLRLRDQARLHLDGPVLDQLESTVRSVQAQLDARLN